METNDINTQINKENNIISNKEEIDLTTKYICENIDKSIIVFCNPISGNQEGKKILNMMNNYISKENYRLIDYQYIQTGKTYEPFKVIAFELINKEDNAKGQKLLKHVVDRCKINQEKNMEEKFWKIRTLIAGGDGTVLSMVDSFVKNGTDIDYCIFGHVPLGTGNDLSNSLGFSDHIDLDEDNMDDLYLIFKKYYDAQFGKIDIWKIDLQLDPNDGEILINSREGKHPLKDENGNVIRRYIRSFINYISLGYDARVGYNFDRRRSDSRNMNKCIYFLEGLKKFFCRRTVTVNGFIESFTVYDSINNSVDQDSFFSEINQELGPNNLLNENINNNTQENNNNNNNIIMNNQPHKIKYQFFASEKALKNQNISDNNKCLVLKGKPCSIIFQNVLNYMSGIKDIWGQGKEHLSVKVKKDALPEIKKKYTNKLLEMANCQQKFDDKMLEVFTFDNGLETGLEKVFKGFAKKIYHGRGPMEVKFVASDIYDKNDRKHRIYLNLDGEYFHIVKPILLTIELNREYSNGQLPFLIGNVQ